MTRLILAFLLITLGGCVSASPKVEFGSYKVVASAVDDSGRIIARELQLAEKKNQQRADISDDKENIGPPSFLPNEAQEYSTAGPKGESYFLIRSLDVLDSYLKTLKALESGQNIGDAKLYIGSKLDDASALSGIGNLNPLTSVANQIIDILSPAIQSGNRIQFQSAVIEAAPVVAKLTDSIRDRTGAYYALIGNDTKMAAEGAAAAQSAVESRAPLARKLYALRSAMADFVFLLEQLKISAIDLKNSVVADRSVLPSSISASRANDAIVAANSVKKSISDNQPF